MSSMREIIVLTPSCPDSCDGKHHYSPCSKCGDVHRVLMAAPGCAMGGVWFRGADMQCCRTCDALLKYVPHEK